MPINMEMIKIRRQLKCQQEIEQDLGASGQGRDEASVTALVIRLPGSRIPAPA